jgi:transcriptional regulator with XRE-family HTH domain
MIPIAENVKRLRKAAGMTQQQLAVAAGLAVSHVAQIEQGINADPRGSTLQALARALDTTVDALLAGPSEAPRRGRRKGE